MGGVKSDYSVCPHLLLQFFQFKSVRLCQVTPGYIRLRQLTSEGLDVELDNFFFESFQQKQFLIAKLQLNIDSKYLHHFSD